MPSRRPAITLLLLSRCWEGFNGTTSTIKPQLQENLKKPQGKTEDLKSSKRPETRHEEAWKCSIQACLTQKQNWSFGLSHVMSLVRSNHYLSNQPSWTCCWAFPTSTSGFLGLQTLAGQAHGRWARKHQGRWHLTPSVPWSDLLRSIVIHFFCLSFMLCWFYYALIFASSFQRILP